MICSVALMSEVELEVKFGPSFVISRTPAGPSHSRIDVMV